MGHTSIAGVFSLALLASAVVAAPFSTVPDKHVKPENSTAKGEVSTQPQHHNASGLHEHAMLYGGEVKPSNTSGKHESELHYEESKKFQVSEHSHTHNASDLHESAKLFGEDSKPSNTSDLHKSTQLYGGEQETPSNSTGKHESGKHESEESGKHESGESGKHESGESGHESGKHESVKHESAKHHEETEHHNTTDLSKATTLLGDDSRNTTDLYNSTFLLGDDSRNTTGLSNSTIYLESKPSNNSELLKSTQLYGGEETLSNTTVGGEETPSNTTGKHESDLHFEESKKFQASQPEHNTTDLHKSSTMYGGEVKPTEHHEEKSHHSESHNTTTHEPDEHHEETEHHNTTGLHKSSMLYGGEVKPTEHHEESHHSELHNSTTADHHEETKHKPSKISELYPDPSGGAPWVQRREAKVGYIDWILPKGPYPTGDALKQFRRAAAPEPAYPLPTGSTPQHHHSGHPSHPANGSELGHYTSLAEHGHHTNHIGQGHHVNETEHGHHGLASHRGNATKPDKRKHHSSHKVRDAEAPTPVEKRYREHGGPVWPGTGSQEDETLHGGEKKHPREKRSDELAKHGWWQPTPRGTMHHGHKNVTEHHGHKMGRCSMDHGSEHKRKEDQQKKAWKPGFTG
ncbi:hypothetical protein EJ03DRAFT_371064 [Teratosphaeria nubilosa]|uniref:Uncharacterized protein n=1 Tax=Teratosphaeria nubilosa TaxID=161662 RepID=A0A6G1LM11_9PEZI|nr:hypothetical protein EJ03DRAFT_371064 [Teratosphaeria nubilosa]